MMRPLFMPMDIMHPPWYNARDECGGVQKRIDLHPREMFNAPHMHPLGCVLLKLNIIPKNSPMPSPKYARWNTQKLEYYIPMHYNVSRLQGGILMFAKRRQYSLNKRITLFYLIPLIFLLAILFLYLNVYRANVEKMAEATFRGLADLKHQQVEDNLNELRSITKEIAYSSLLQQYLVETNESEKVQTYGHFQNYLRAITTNSEAIISAYASLGKHSRVHMADGYLFTFEETQKRLNLEEKLDKNAEYFTELKSLPGASAGQLYGMYF